MYFRVAALMALTLSSALPASAQEIRSSRIEGTLTDSVHARPLAGARVVAVGAGSRTDVQRATTTDSAGRYHIDSLPAGRYAVGFESALLDSLEMAVSPREATVEQAHAAKVDLVLPPPSKLLAAVCPGVTLPPQAGAIVGHVVDAETENPLPGLLLALSWQERGVDRSTLKPDYRERTASATTDSSGWYRLCGVPTDTWLSMQLQHLGRTGPVIRALVGDTLRISVRHLSFSASASLPALDSAARESISSSDPDSVSTPLLSGTAMLSGVVRGLGDTPLVSAEVRVRGASGMAKTDELGRYSLRGLPDGTQMLDVRHVGYSAAEVPVELRSGVMVTSDVRMQRVANLDSMRVVAKRMLYKEFNEMQSHKIFGVFIGPEEMEWRWRAAYASDVIRLIPGYKIVGEGKRSRVVNGRGAQAFQCSPNIVIDGAQNMTINDIEPIDIGAIAAYRMGDQGPPEYEKGCGVILLWTKR
jgi:hypothetical protein